MSIILLAYELPVERAQDAANVFYGVSERNISSSGIRSKVFG